MTIYAPDDMQFFPYNVVHVLERFLAEIDPDIVFYRRRLTEVDPDGTIGIIPVGWNGLLQEIGRNEPSLQTYTLYVQSLIVDPDEARGIASHSYFAKRVREMLVRSEPLKVGLQSLTTTDPATGVIESFASVKTGDQIFHEAEADGNFRYLATLELRLETQIQ